MALALPEDHTLALRHANFYRNSTSSIKPKQKIHLFYLNDKPNQQEIKGPAKHVTKSVDPCGPSLLRSKAPSVHILLCCDFCQNSPNCSEFWRIFKMLKQQNKFPYPFVYCKHSAKMAPRFGPISDLNGSKIIAFGASQT